MTWTVRIAAALLLAAIMFGVKEVAHWAIDTSILVWIALMAAIFWVGIMYENKDRAADGLPRYSWSDARKDMAMPLSFGAAIMVIAYWLR